MGIPRYADGGNLLATSHRVYADELRIAEHLREIRNHELYRADGYEDFESFCEKEFGMPFAIAKNMIRSLEAYEVSRN